MKNPRLYRRSKQKEGTKRMEYYFCTGMDYVIQIKKKGSDRIIDDVLNVKNEFKKELML
ncbi:hypothetical protein [Helicobacter pylori]|uniref:hypothetical protein n=1 Tax=Helicobacter pylori TaxID=210 RepID=UPI0039F110DD